MVAEIMRALLSILILTNVAAMLSSCAGFEHGNGLSRLDTETPEDKAEQKWFDKYYGQQDKTCDDSFWSTDHFCNP